MLQEQGIHRHSFHEIEFFQEHHALYCDQQSQPKILTLYKTVGCLEVHTKDLLVSTKEKDIQNEANKQPGNPAL